MSGVELQGIRKQYGPVLAVQGVDLHVEEGIFFSLLGPSGCGKTTTLRIIAGFIQPTSGQVLLDGQDITTRSPEKRDMGMVFQNYAIFPHMSVFDNIAFGLKMRRVPKERIRERVVAALKQVGFSSHEDRYSRELSGGEQQRVALARVLVIEPKVLLLDEPLSALDKQLREEMQFWIKDLQRKLAITTIYVTHDQVEAMTVSDRMVVMNKGRVDQVGTPREIYERPQTKFVATFIGESNAFDGVVRQQQGRDVSVKCAGLELAAQSASDLGAGQKVTLLVRPEKIAIHGAGRAGLPATSTVLQGSVVDCVYRGAQTRYAVRLTSGQALIVDSQPAAEHQAFVPGDPVTVSWEPGDASVLRE